MKAENKKSRFNLKIYAFAVILFLTAVIVVLTVFTFKSRYNAFSPEKTAQSFVDGIVQTGDGYNAFKLTLVSKNQKYGTFITDAYMSPYVNEETEKAAFVGTGSDEEAEKTDELYGVMYDHFISLISGKGFDDYDAFFTDYFKELSDVRKNIFGDEYMDTEFMFSVLESNVDRFGKSLTGSDAVLAADGKTVLSEATKGLYQERYGDEYKFVTFAEVTEDLDDAAVKEYIAAYKERIAPLASSGEERAKAAGFESDYDKAEAMIAAFKKLDCSDEIVAVKKLSVDVALDASDSVVASLELYVVKIGSSWYVDETNVDTTGLYYN